MPDPRDDALARELRDLSPWLATPAPPDVRAAVRQRLSTGTRPGSSTRWLAAAVTVLLALVIALVPQTRLAVAHAATALLRLAGIELDQTPRSGSYPRPRARSPRPAPPASPGGPVPIGLNEFDGELEPHFAKKITAAGVIWTDRVRRHAPIRRRRRTARRRPA
jgi:hypothetical protein